jgi:hypothetical protein
LGNFKSSFQLKDLTEREREREKNKKRHIFKICRNKGWPPEGDAANCFVFFLAQAAICYQVWPETTKFVKASTVIAFKQVLRNSSKTLDIDNKIKTKFDRKKFTWPLSLGCLLGFRGKVHFLWLNLVLILLSISRVLLLFRKKGWSAILRPCLHKCCD